MNQGAPGWLCFLGMVGYAVVLFTGAGLRLMGLAAPRANVFFVINAVIIVGGVLPITGFALSIIGSRRRVAIWVLFLPAAIIVALAGAAAWADLHGWIKPQPFSH